MVYSFSIVGWFNMVSPGWFGLLQQRGRRIVVMRAAHVFMFRTGTIRLQREGGLPIQATLENRLQAGVGAGLQLDGALAGRFEPGGRVGLGQAQDSQTGPVADLGMRLA